MTFTEWLYTTYPNPEKNGRWGFLHILTLVLCITAIVAIAFIFRKKSEKAKKVVLWTIAGLLLAFELTRRIVNLTRGNALDIHSLMYILLPRPWCAIASFMLILAPIVNKKSWYTAASISGLICTLILFAYPGVGFNNEYILFENLYSICTHSIILVGSISLLTLKYTEKDFRNIWKTFVYLLVIVAYALLEIFVLVIEKDPLYFMPGNDVMKILSTPYWLYLIIWAGFISMVAVLYYLFPYLKRKRQK